nr:hypothetical protein [Rhodococcus sp. CX]
MLGLAFADLLLHGRIDVGLLGDRMPHQLDGHLVGEILAPLPRLVGSDAVECLEFGEHPFHFAVIVGEDLDHVALARCHRYLPFDCSSGG